VIARGPSESRPEENAAALLGCIMTLEAGASPDGLNLVIGMSKRPGRTAPRLQVALTRREGWKSSAVCSSPPRPQPRRMAKQASHLAALRSRKVNSRRQ
jgi:hypothetical protein